MAAIVNFIRKYKFGFTKTFNRTQLLFVVVCGKSNLQARLCQFLKCQCLSERSQHDFAALKDRALLPAHIGGKINLLLAFFFTASVKAAFWICKRKMPFNGINVDLGSFD